MKSILKKKAVMISCVIICVLVVGTICGIVIQSAGGKATFQSHITAAEKYLSELEYEQAIAEYTAALEIEPNNSMVREALGQVYLEYADSCSEMGDFAAALEILQRGYAQLEDERLSESAERVEKEREEHQNEEQVKAEENQNKGETENATEEMENSDIEVCEYLTRYEELVSVLEMEQAGPWQFDGTDSYEKDGFQLEYQQQYDIYSMKNAGAEHISLYGTKLGDGIDETEKKLKENRWLEAYRYSDRCSYANEIDGNYCGLEISWNQEGKVTEWYLWNWLEGEDYTEVFDKLERRDLIEKPELQGWKSAYLSFIENYIEEHKDEERGIYYEDVIDEVQFALVYIDNDDIPELIIDGMSMADGTEVVTYHDGRIEREGFGGLGIYYLERQGKIYSGYGSMDSYGDEIYEIQNGKFVQTAAGDYGAEDNTNVQIDTEGNPIYRYRWNGTEVTKEEYELLLAAAFDRSAAKDSYDSECYYWELQEQIKAY